MITEGILFRMNVILGNIRTIMSYVQVKEKLQNIIKHSETIQQSVNFFSTSTSKIDVFLLFLGVINEKKGIIYSTLGGLATLIARTEALKLLA